MVLLFSLFGTMHKVFSLPTEKEKLANIVPIDQVTDLINGTIETLRPDIPSDFSITGNFPLSFSDSLLNGTLELSEIHILGLQDFLIPYVYAGGLITIKMIMVFPVIELDANYDTNLVVLDVLPIYGKDTARILVDNLQISIGVDVVILSSPIQLSNLKVEIEVEHVDLDIEGLLDDENFSTVASGLLTTVANSVIVSYLNDNVKEISDTISPPIQDAINALLAGDDSGDVFVQQKIAAAQAEILKIIHQKET